MITVSLFRPTVVRERRGQKIREKTRVWWVRWQDPATGKRRSKTTGCKFKSAAQQFAAKFARDLEMGLVGVDLQMIERTRRPLSDHIKEFIKARHTRRVTDEYVELVEQRIRDTCKACGFKSLNDINAADIEVYLAGRIRAGELGVASRNHYIRSIKMFARWCIQQQLPVDSLAVLRLENAEADRKYVRRAMSNAEVAKLLGSVPRERAVLYLLCGCTGYRRSEVASLRPCDFSFENDLPFVCLRPSKSKGRRAKRLEEPIPLQAEVAGIIKAFFVGFEDNDCPWEWLRKTRTAEMIRKDLKNAGIDVADAQGRVVDFHAWRTYFGSTLAKSNVPLALAQKLMRHSTPVLTSNTYTQAGVSDLAEQVDKMPGLADNVRKK